jgi:hypothetical protein
MGLGLVRRGVRAASRRRAAGGSPAIRTTARGNDEMTGNKNSAQIVVPGSVQAGDVMLVVGAQNTGANTQSISGGGSGASWSPRQAARTVSGNNLRAYLWSARAAGGSAGSTITVSASGSARFPALLVVCSGVTETGIVTDFQLVNAAGLSHAFPAVTVPSPGGYLLVGIGALRRGDAVAASLAGGAPAGAALDDESNTAAPAQPNLTVSGLHVTSTVAAGSRTPGTATSDLAVSSVLFTIALPPAA